jgi:hypothetical protein
MQADVLQGNTVFAAPRPLREDLGVFHSRHHADLAGGDDEIEDRGRDVLDGVAGAVGHTAHASGGWRAEPRFWPGENGTTR